MDGFFQFPYRWDQLLGKDLDTQISLLQERDNDLEKFFHEGGRCSFEFPFRWAQFWPALLAGEPWAIGIAEENDRTIENLFGLCSCGEFPLNIQITGGPISPSATFSYTFERDNTMQSFSSEGFTGTGPFTATHVLSKNAVPFYTRGPAGTGTDIVVESFTAGDVLTVDVTINTGSATTHTASCEFIGTDDVLGTWI